MRYLILLAALALGACSQTPVKTPASDVASMGNITDLHSGATLTLEQLLTRLAQQPRVIVGEKHDNPYHHQIEQWLVQQLPQLRPQGSVLMEMINPNQQAQVDKVKQWLQSDPTVRDGRVAELIAWQPGWEWALYGGVTMAAMRAPYPLWSANLDRSEIAAFYQQPQFPAGQLSSQPAVRKALEETIRTSHGGQIEAAQLHAMLAIQQQRDRRMAERLLAAPTPALLIAGGYHAAKSVGVPLHVRDLQPAAAPTVLMLAEPGVQVDAHTADYLWITPSVK
ncbi:TPA: ChaN family lipoprotein [Serratia marcescens]|uniref:ChaN family lipoprotein n=1 Tax=Serratia TaxID=613 RepID=UPI000D3E7305|nr:MULTISPECIES: ChaN family lipoprotein [Serratia]AWC81481.1 iron-regulated protein [Serratia marcescens]MBH2616174.1 ChaN family lipoprotein [Serratia ureilytica]MBH2684828.1 ChaN family lipoprotein [Serratia ureilytica]UAN29522.1 ChaN family lipoprotein [Serratia ureilytica]